MAIDTAAKRKSASQTLTGLFGPGVTPDATSALAWRQQSGWGYSGIALGGDPPSPDPAKGGGSMILTVGKLMSR